MPKAGYCTECEKNVWLNEDGSCQEGHPASSITNVYEAQPKKQNIQKQSFLGWFGKQRIATQAILVLGVILFFSCFVASIAGQFSRPPKDYSQGYREGYHAAEENLKVRIKELETKIKELERKPTSSPATKAPKPSQPAQSKTWHQVTVFDGDGNKDTEPFKIQGSQWRVTYTLDGGEYSVLGFFAYPVGQESGAVASGTKNNPGTDVTYAYRSGEFYLKILVANGSYHVVVEDYY